VTTPCAAHSTRGAAIELCSWGGCLPGKSVTSIETWKSLLSDLKQCRSWIFENKYRRDTKDVEIRVSIFIQLRTECCGIGPPHERASGGGK
jgi:hypothetical protein